MRGCANDGGPGLRLGPETRECAGSSCGTSGARGTGAAQRAFAFGAVTWSDAKSFHGVAFDSPDTWFNGIAYHDGWKPHGGGWDAYDRRGAYSDGWRDPHRRWNSYRGWWNA